MQLVGLTTLNILINPTCLKKLKSNVWNEELFPAKLVVDDNAYEIGITYRGEHTRRFRKKSYRIDFGEYSRVFAGRELHFNAEYRDPSLIRNKLSLDFFHSIGTTSLESRHVFLELNDEPIGVYLKLEAVDNYFLQRRKLPYGPIFYATTNHANFSLLTPRENPKPALISGYERKLGNDEDSRDLAMLIYKVNTMTRSEFGEEIYRYVDVEKYLKWLCGVICTQNFDGFIHNYALYRNGATHLYQLIPWDYDATWGRDWDGDIMEYDQVPIQGYNTLTARMLDIKSIRTQYRLNLEEILETAFTVAVLEPKIINLYSQLRPYLSLDPFKKRAIDEFDREPEVILKFISDRNCYLRNHLKDLK